MTANKEIETILLDILTLVNKNKYKKASSELNSLVSGKFTAFTQRDWQVIGDIALTIGNPDAAKDAFHNASNLEGVIFAHIINGSFTEAQKLLASSLSSPAASWCKFLLYLFLDDPKLKTATSFLQIRHFLEFTVYCLLVMNKQDYINKILDKLNSILKVNQDAEKFIGYAYYHFGNYKKAIKHLDNALLRNQYDGEIYFVLGQLYEEIGELNNSLAMLENASLFLPEHFPTKVLKHKVLTQINA